MGIIKRTPWSGIMSLVGMAACLVASAVVVGVSYNQSVALWPVRPPVLLAVFSAASGILYSSALNAGIAVRFWLNAYRGTRLSELHYIWDHGRGISLISTVRGGSRARKVTLLASVGYVAQFAAGPILQRSTFQTLRDRTTFPTMSIDITRRFADGWFGDRYEANSGLYEYRHGLPQLQQWWHRDAITTRNESGYACWDGKCDGLVPGAGFAHDCWTTTERVNLGTNGERDVSVLSVTLWVAQNKTDQPFLRLRTRYLSDVDRGCMGTVQAETCYITAATVEYPITIQNTTVSLRDDPLLNMRVLSTYYSHGDNPDLPKGVAAGPLLSLRNFVLPVLAENATRVLDATFNRSSYGAFGSLADIFFVPEANNTDPSPSTCRLKFTSPTEYALRVMYQFMFRFALAAGSGIQTEKFDTEKISPTLVYRVDAHYLAVGLAALGCSIAFVAALMWNWWLLGRHVTLSPLETSAALGMPVLPHNPHASLHEILREARDLRSGVGSLHQSPRGTVEAEIEKC